MLGSWSRIDDVNVLVDAGADPEVLRFLEAAPTGVGKRKLDLVVLTHRHYDHITMLPALKERFDPVVAAWGPATDGVDRSLVDGERLRFGDELFEVIHTPGHTDDSVCFYGTASHTLFVGDTPVIVNGTDGTYEPRFVDAMRRLATLPVACICFGHGERLTEGCERRLRESYENVRRCGERRDPQGDRR